MKGGMICIRPDRDRRSSSQSIRARQRIRWDVNDRLVDMVGSETNVVVKLLLSGFVLIGLIRIGGTRRGSKIGERLAVYEPFRGRVLTTR